MANTVTLSQMRTKVRRRADMENTTFISDDELNDWINDSKAELYDIVIQKFEDYYLTSYSFSTTSGTAGYGLPSDFYKLRGVDLVSNGQSYTLQPFMFNERNKYQANAISGVYSQEFLLYRLTANDIRFVPTPTSTESITLWYIPVYPKLEKDTDVLDYGIVPGWEEYIEVDCAIKCLEKEESDTSQLLVRKQFLTKRIEGAAGGRDANAPQRVIDVSTLGTSFDYRST